MPSSSPATKAHAGRMNVTRVGGEQEKGEPEGGERIDPQVAFASERGPSLHLGEGGKTSAGTREKQEKDEPETKTNARDKRENPEPEAAGERRPSSSPASKAHVGQTNANEGRRRTGANEGRGF